MAWAKITLTRPLLAWAKITPTRRHRAWPKITPTRPHRAWAKITLWVVARWARRGVVTSEMTFSSDVGWRRRPD
ncbi:hypothetical protein YM304_17420 [Ilumatobacter coccineus YM16-304]|uniref:Uncharacterized protein n=1 Tax=Ilumatobacter coccineus (strain NBRC 103263 / KCTC 29153 / YM16-304) TaxID=1313172 RepID=A0A6C7EDI5_ILUCY|nr:hypothetical protein YM304_17420 [Ilumatobacter coccineus YM16-304]